MLIPGTQDKVNLKNILIILFLAAIYFLSGKWGLSLAFLHPSATPIWAPTGISIAAFLILGARVWPGILLGAFLVNLTTQGTAATSFGIAVGNTFEGYASAYLVNRFIGLNEAFLKPLNIFKYVVLVGVVSTMVSATVGVASLFLGGLIQNESVSSVWTTWWLGDMGGALVIAPLILLWRADYKINWSPSRAAEAVALLVLLTLLSLLIFGGVLPSSVSNYPLAFISLPVLIWIAFRFRPRETATSIFILFAIAIYGTLNSLGPFATGDANQSLVTIQIFIATIFLGVMPLAAASWEQRRTETALRSSEEQYRKLIETSPDAIVVTDLTGTIQAVNGQALRLYGLRNQDEIVGKSGFDFIAVDDKKKTQDALVEVLKRGSISGVEYVSVRKGGEHFNASANASVLLDSSGKPQALIVVVHDVTQTKELDRMKSEFVSLASHQLRTPLGSMRWSVEMLLNGDYGVLPTTFKGVIQDLYDSIIRLIQLVNDLLDVSRIEEGRIFDNPENIDVVPLLNRVIHHLSPLASKKGVKIYFDEPRSAIESITIDKGKLTDVFQNLLSNAIKYSKSGGRVDISLEKEDKVVRAHFKDSGIGIPKEDRELVFTKFYRSQEASGLESEGTGLGLFIIKSYLDAWGGRIDFKSEHGKGSEFIVEIPEKARLKTEKKKQTNGRN